MGNVEVHDLAPVRSDERKELNLSRKISYKQYEKHKNGDYHEACLTELPWNIRDSVSLYESMSASFNAITELPAELPLRLPHLSYLDLSNNALQKLPDSFGLLFHLKTLMVQHNKLRELPEAFVHLVKLEKIDLSYNQLRELPEDLGKMESLSKLNVSHNKLRLLPVSLGGCETLTLVLAVGNRLTVPPQSISNEGSEPIIKFLRRKFSSVSICSASEIKVCVNIFPRVRGNQCQSIDKNNHSVHSQYIQVQTDTTNTPVRIKTPLLPPLNATKLDPDQLGDKIIGMIYGAAIGDAIGISTRWMGPDECSFYYPNPNITYKDIIVGENRVWWRQGDWTCNVDHMIIVLDSIISWAGVVDELDFSKRLLNWYQNGFTDLGDTEGVVLSQTLLQLFSMEDFTTNPHRAAEAVLKEPVYYNLNGDLDSADSMSDSGIDSPQKSMFARCKKRLNAINIGSCDDFGCDNAAVTRSPILGVPSFHDIIEVKNNAVRICRGTHVKSVCVASSVMISTMVALMLQGKYEDDIDGLIHESISHGAEFISNQEERNEFLALVKAEDLQSLNAREDGKGSHTFKPITAAIIALKSKSDYKSTILDIVMSCGDSNSNACVAGAIMGCKMGFSRLPTHWIDDLRSKQTNWLNVKINCLLDMMGIP
ncbi:uncharacterized protein LOC126828227 [Patella vulgata]|uniref:uncharacterized protein LOC126828227 n=1 Tax=Patella vulgata TaxID=6465 RepID=UPI00217F8B84|nr:uncharacterized protein LOC126828227 [Patella vulgata]XP_050413835.1 uncharacterized protein LOC126828227 [Patella vulgata]XP_050413836.1 uncharacterized protein LOC126828227 [Patella vulgata]XP_050413838.1 uncharacterized protein LOC126828227 [Patella vulgata]